MAKILLVAVNASYSHTALSVRGLCEFVRAQGLPGVEIDFIEVTINQPFGDILREIAAGGADVVLFSTYIWNGELVSKIICDVKKVLPGAFVGAGGPEFGFTAEKYLSRLGELDFIMKGEGERTLTEVCKLAAGVNGDLPSGSGDLTSRGGESCCCGHSPSEGGDLLSAGAALFSGENSPSGWAAGFLNGLKNIPGIFYRGDNGAVCFSGERDVLCDLSGLPFPYPALMNPDGLSDEERNHKIYYYESSRGCPFSCSYCMSSIDRHVRFMPLDRVFRDLQIFLDAGVGLVKFVDRTYNIDPDRYVAIWDYILSHHNGKTMFHFEIEAEYLSDGALEFLQKVPAGVMQFEIGVQSSNKKTLAAISRSTNIEKLKENVCRVPKTIHQHLDLIAGLPYEDLESFGHSFDFVMSMRPDALQLGFLKVLSGTVMESYAKKNGWKWMENPVYETFSTPYMSYDDMIFLKDLEVAVDAYWNSGVFSHFMGFVLRKWPSIWSFFREFTLWGEKKGVFDDARRETFWFGLMAEYIGVPGGGINIREGNINVPAGGFNLPGANLPELNINLPEAPINLPESNINLPKAPINLPAGVEKSLLYDLLRYDFILRGKQGNFPGWYKHIYDKDKHRGLLEAEGGVINPRLAFGHSEYEVFDWDVEADEPELCKGKVEKLIKYKMKK